MKLNKSIFIFESPQKTGIRFFWKKFLHKCLFKIPLWRKIDNVTSYFLISSKNLKAVYLSFHWFNDSRTRGFELVTREFELVTRGFELEFWILTCAFKLSTRAFKLSTRNSLLVTHVLPNHTIYSPLNIKFSMTFSIYLKIIKNISNLKRFLLQWQKIEVRQI